MVPRTRTTTRCTCHSWLCTRKENCRRGCGSTFSTRTQLQICRHSPNVSRTVTNSSATTWYAPVESVNSLEAVPARTTISLWKPRSGSRAGWRAEVHSLSATDFQQEIQNYEAAHAEFPITDLRWVIAHVPFITEPWVNRLKAIGGGLSLTSWRYLAGTPAQNGPPFRMIVDNGIHVGMSSDGMQIAPMNPWLHMYYAITGLNARQIPINHGQQITRQEVLKLYTANNGWFMREEDQIGTIEAGKLADLVVLSDDYFSV